MLHEEKGIAGMNPYDCCPTLETKHFNLRLVKEADAKDLLLCYSDPQVQCIVNNDNCTSDFKYSTLDEMLECIRLHTVQGRPYTNKSGTRSSRKNPCAK